MIVYTFATCTPEGEFTGLESHLEADINITALKQADDHENEHGTHYYCDEHEGLAFYYIEYNQIDHL